MRFLENGADIPNDLIGAVNDGTVIFLCGAGVSFGAGLPSFEGLTEWVYQRLGESWKTQAAERKAIENKEFDRALRSLEKRTHCRKRRHTFETRFQSG
jgi:NAD-dependent SIR2 family protein deacetylase